VLLAALLATVTLASSHAPAHLRAGARLGEIRISRIGLVAEVDQGADTLYTAAWPAELDHGAAHYPDTALPWHQGTVGIAGHRVTHTKPFLRLNRVRKNDLIVLATRWGVFRYRVFAMKIVKPTALWVLRGRLGHRLVLTACHPPHSDSERLVVFARRSAVR
jgi:sortase A